MAQNSALNFTNSMNSQKTLQIQVQIQAKIRKKIQGKISKTLKIQPLRKKIQP